MCHHPTLELASRPLNHMSDVLYFRKWIIAESENLGLNLGEPWSSSYPDMTTKQAPTQEVTRLKYEDNEHRSSLAKYTVLR